MLTIDERLLVRLSKKMEAIFNEVGREATTIEIVAALLLTLSIHMIDDPSWQSLMEREKAAR